MTTSLADRPDDILYLICHELSGDSRGLGRSNLLPLCLTCKKLDGIARPLLLRVASWITDYEGYSLCLTLLRHPELRGAVKTLNIFGEALDGLVEEDSEEEQESSSRHSNVLNARETRQELAIAAINVGLPSLVAERIRRNLSHDALAALLLAWTNLLSNLFLGTPKHHTMFNYLIPRLLGSRLATGQPSFVATTLRELCMDYNAGERYTLWRPFNGHYGIPFLHFPNLDTVELHNARLLDPQKPWHYLDNGVHWPGYPQDLKDAFPSLTPAYPALATITLPPPRSSPVQHLSLQNTDLDDKGLLMFTTSCKGLRSLYIYMNADSYCMEDKEYWKRNHSGFVGILTAAGLRECILQHADTLEELSLIIFPRDLRKPPSRKGGPTLKQCHKLKRFHSVAGTWRRLENVAEISMDLLPDGLEELDVEYNSSMDSANDVMAFMAKWRGEDFERSSDWGSTPVTSDADDPEEGEGWWTSEDEDGDEDEQGEDEQYQGEDEIDLPGTTTANV